MGGSTPSPRSVASSPRRMAPGMTMLLVGIVVASSKPSQLLGQRLTRWCPPSPDSLTGTWVAPPPDTEHRNVLGVHLNSAGILLRRDGTVMLAHSGSNAAPYRWTYATAKCELTLTLGRLDPASSRVLRADAAAGRIEQFDSSAKSVVVILEGDPPRFFFKGSYFRRQ